VSERGVSERIHVNSHAAPPPPPPPLFRAFGSTEAFNDRLCIAYNITTLLSPQDTCSCCNSAHGFSSGGCDGGFTEDAFNYFKKVGVVTGGDNPSVGSGSSCFPYQLKECGHHEASPLIPCPQVCSPGECATPKCPTTCSEKAYTTPFSKDKHFAKAGAFRMSSIAQAQTEIMTHGSISAAFTVYSDFLTYTSGVYTHKTGSELGGHAVKIYGWGTSSDGTDYWLVANSWNNYWGMNGSFMIARGTDECGIEDDLVAGTA
jgi:cathepsin B